MLIRYETEVPAGEDPPSHGEFDILEDGEPPQSIYFPLEPGTDVRFLRAQAPKPTVEGANLTLVIRVYKDSTIVDRRIVGGTLIASASCPGVTVVP